MSKGSKQRPLKVSKDQMEDNWNRIFGKKDEKASNDKSDTKKRTRPQVDKVTFEG